jgi:hypothetical protein
MANASQSTVSRLQMKIADGILALARAIGPDETIAWLRGLTVAFSDGLSTPNEKRSQLLASIAAAERETPGGLHSVARLRSTMAWGPEAFDEAVVDLLQSGALGGHPTDLVTEAVRAEAVAWRGQWIVGVYPRQR